MMKISVGFFASIYFVFSLALTAEASEADAKRTLFTPCQYKKSYRYYMDRGDSYRADGQLESALESYERALIVQPNDADILLKIRKIKSLLDKKGRRRPIFDKSEAMERAMRDMERQAKREAMERAMRDMERQAKREAMERAMKDIEIRMRWLKREPPPDIEELQDKDVPPILPLDRRDFPIPHQDEYCKLIKFSNAFNDKIQQSHADISSGIAPATIKGEYRVSFGATNDDFLWKDANADHHNMPGDTSWRYLFGRDRYNTYDKGVYNQLKVEIESPINNYISSYNEIVIDPWTFVGKKRVFVTAPNGDNVEMDLKYWSNVRKTINETYRSQNGDIVNVQESKVIEGETSAETYFGLSDWGSQGFNVPKVEIDRMYFPVRKSWIEYTNEPYYAKLFFMATQDEALTSDDPMRLSNNKIWWEESPWIDTYEPSRVFNRKGTSAPGGFNRTREPLKKGQWVRNQSFIARDSEDQRLTFLRGVSLGGAFNTGTTVRMVAACPRNLWNTYEQATSIPAAVRVKTSTDNRLTLGGLYTLKTGFRHNSVEAINNLVAVDGSYELFPETQLLAEVAASTMDVDEAIGYSNNFSGYGWMVGVKMGTDTIFYVGEDREKMVSVPIFELDTSFTHMDDKFFPGLSNYRFTRKEFEFAKHIYFDDLNPANEVVKIGDGVDVGRNSFDITAKAAFPDQYVDTRFDFRNVHSDGGDFIESALRAEGEFKPTAKLTLKGLAYFLHLPDTTKGIDPLINAKNSYTAFTDYFAYEDAWLENTEVRAGKDPSIGAFSAGLKYDFFDYLSASGILEVTNDPKDWPRGLLNNTYVSDTYKDGVIWDKVVPFLYDQGSFLLPPYDYYRIYKGRLIYYPFKPLKLTFNYVYNENKYAMAIDDNSTHQGIELEYKPNSRTTLGFLYQYTRQRDLYKELTLEKGYNFDGHHNIYAALGYDLNEYQRLQLIFGEYVGYAYPYPEEHSALSALDTRHIVKVIYSGSWGEPRNPHFKASLDGQGTPLGPFNLPIGGATFVTDLYLGEVSYEDEAALNNVESGWDAYFAKVKFGIDAYDKEYWEGALGLGLFGSLEEEETWDRDGTGAYQKNNMAFAGADVDLDFGWAFTFDTPSKYLSFTPLLHAGYRRLEYKRSDISVVGTAISELGEVDENANVAFLGIGGKLDYVPFPEINLYASGYYSPIVNTTFNNDLLGRLKSNKGSILHAEGGCGYTLENKLGLNIGGFWDLQDLDRAERINSGVVTAEIPDNKLETFGLKLGGSYRF